MKLFGTPCIDHAIRNMRAMAEVGTQSDRAFQVRMVRGRILGRVAAAGRGIPEFRDDGTLPPGIWRATREQFAERFAQGSVRANLWNGTQTLFDEVGKQGVRDAFIGGSFVTSKAEPGDVDIALLTRDLYTFGGAVQDAVKGARRLDVNSYPAQIVPSDWSRLGPHMSAESTFLDLFSAARDGTPRGVVHIDPAART